MAPNLKKTPAETLEENVNEHLAPKGKPQAQLELNEDGLPAKRARGWYDRSVLFYGNVRDFSKEWNETIGQYIYNPIETSTTLMPGERGVGWKLMENQEVVQFKPMPKSYGRMPNFRAVNLAVRSSDGFILLAEPSKANFGQREHFDIDQYTDHLMNCLQNQNGKENEFFIPLEAMRGVVVVYFKPPGNDFDTYRDTLISDCKERGFAFFELDATNPTEVRATFEKAVEKVLQDAKEERGIRLIDPNERRNGPPRGTPIRALHKSEVKQAKEAKKPLSTWTRFAKLLTSKS